MGNISDYLLENETLFKLDMKSPYPYYEILGAIRRKGQSQVLLIRCDVCASDSELYGEGVFKTTRQNLKVGTKPCGCSLIRRKTEAELATLILREVQDFKQDFIGFEGEYKGIESISMFSCGIHGKWKVKAKEILYGSGNCRKCSKISASRKGKPSDDEYIQRFLSTGSFEAGTSFWRSDRKDKQQRSPYWWYNCPACGVTGESNQWDLLKGSRGCSCYRGDQTEAYIHLVKTFENSIFIKFGIARNSEERIKTLNSVNKDLILENMFVFHFESSYDCRKAETQCKRIINTGVLQKDLMPQGYTESTTIANISKIIEIFEQNGGKIMELLPSQERAIEDMLKQNQQRLNDVYMTAIRKCVSVINSDKYLSEENKKRIIEGFYK